MDPDNFTPLYDVNLAKALANDDWEVEWVTSSHQFDLMPNAHPVQVREAFFRNIKRPPFKNLYGVRYSQKIRRLLKAAFYPLEMALFVVSCRGRKPGIVHVQWALFPYLDSFFWKTLQGMGWLVVFTCHDPLPLRGSLPSLYSRANYHLCSAADAVIVHGDWARRTLEKACVPSDKIHVVDPGPPNPGVQTECTFARHALGLNPTTPVLLFFGYIKHYKGLSILLESLPMIRSVIGDLLLLIAGEMMDNKFKYLKLIDKYKITNSVRWSAGYVPDELSSFYFAAADVVVLPYQEASSSGVLLNAYDARKPVVASAIGDIPSMVEDGQTGILVVPGDPVALSSAITPLLLDPEKAKLMGAKGHQLVKSRFNWTKIAKHTAGIYSMLSLNDPVFGRGKRDFRY